MAQLTESQALTFFVTSNEGETSDVIFEALTPVLERLGAVKLVKHPESSLTYLANEAEAAGSRAIQIAIGRPDACYLNPALPTILVPLWDYSNIPQVDLHRNPRLNWTRIANRADLILAPSRMTADAFRSANVETPIIRFPIPPRAEWPEIPTWGPKIRIRLDVAHIVWGGHSSACEMKATSQVLKHEQPRKSSPGIKKRFRWIKQHLSNDRLQRFDARLGQIRPYLKLQNPIRLLSRIGQAGYRRTIGPWISDHGHQTLKHFRNRFVIRRNESHAAATLPSTPLDLSGLIYHLHVDLNDPTHDYESTITAAIHAFQNRADVTIVIELKSSQELTTVERIVHSTGLKFQCQFVIITEILDETMKVLLRRASTFFIATSRTKGWSQTMVEALAAGRPVIAPLHSTYNDWLDFENSFAVDAIEEPTAWPFDPTGTHRTSWNRVNWSQLRDALMLSAKIARDDHVAYEGLSIAARDRVETTTGIDDLAVRLKDSLALLTDRPVGAVAW
jgi:glycosyltransferase involved in cell wall biosynthesis